MSDGLGGETYLFGTGVPGGTLYVADKIRHAGRIFWVDSQTGTDASGFGGSPKKPVATLAYAIGLCTSGRGDTIYVMAGHNEGLGDAQITLNKAAVTIIGLGRGSERPRIDYDHANASIDITANDCRLSNLQLLPSVTAVLVAIDVNAGVLNTIIDHVETLPGEDGGGVDEFAVTVDVKAGCTRTRVEDCVFAQDPTAAGVVACVKFTGASLLCVVRRCAFWCAGAALVAGINGDTGASLWLLIDDCTFDMDAEPAIEMLTGTTGVIRNCKVRADLATLNAGIVADAMARFDCHIAEPGEAGGVIGTPTADD